MEWRPHRLSLQLQQQAKAKQDAIKTLSILNPTTSAHHYFCSYPAQFKPHHIPFTSFFTLSSSFLRDLHWNSMSGSYAQNFSPARALSPHLRTPPDVDSQYLTELLAEHQKLGPFAQVVPICGRLLNQGFSFAHVCFWTKSFFLCYDCDLDLLLGVFRAQS